MISVALPIERKGILEFISLARTMSDVRFIWFGSLSTVLIPSRIRKAISEAPLNVLFPGFVDQRELVEAYSGADCFLFMSYEETEGIAVLEALSSSLPVVLRAIPVYSSLAEKGLVQNLFRTQEECRDIVKGILDGTADDVSAIERGIAKERSLWRSGIALRKVYREELHEEP